MGNYTIFWMFENPRSGRQARNFTTNVPKILYLKSSSEQIFSENCRWVPLNRVRNTGGFTNYSDHQYKNKVIFKVYGIFFRVWFDFVLLFRELVCKSKRQ